MHLKGPSINTYLGPRPPSLTAPSTWVADVETPYKKPSGSLRPLVLACKYAGLNRGGSGPTEKFARGSRTRVILAFTTGIPLCSTDCHTIVYCQARAWNMIKQIAHTDPSLFGCNQTWWGQEEEGNRVEKFEHMQSVSKQQKERWFLRELTT